MDFISREGTQRHAPPARAAPITAGLPPFVTPVGVFWDHATGHVKAVAEECGLGALQFHGDEAPEDLDGYRLPTIKAIKVDGPEALRRMAGYRVSAFLLDSPARWSEGEARPPISWELARQAREAGRRIILSAGLTADNVAEAVCAATPYAVDVNSGVEMQPGRKDPDKVRRFIASARAAP